MRMRAVLFSIFFLAIHPRLGKANISVGFTPEKTCFSVSYRGESSPYKVTPIFALPGEVVKLDIEPLGSETGFDVKGRRGEWKSSSPVKWTWKAPSKPGFYPARVTELVSGETMDLNIFVMVPYGKLRAG